ncbi:MAG: TonB family protein [Campylobacterota bacterium]|nr:TonB family protein [Campylobacterota bacterium]
MIKEEIHVKLLLLSILLSGVLFYLIFKNNKYQIIAPLTPPAAQTPQQIISMVLSEAEPTPIDKEVLETREQKKIVKAIKPIRKEPKKIVKKEHKIEKIVKREPNKIVKKMIKTETAPIFDAGIKEQFIANLYSILEQRKKYPKMAKRRNLEGVVKVNFTLKKDGKIENIFIDKSCGHSILDKSAFKLIASIGVYKAIPDVVSIKAMQLSIPIKYSRI